MSQDDNVKIVSDDYRQLPSRAAKSPERKALEEGKTIFVTDSSRLGSLITNVRGGLRAHRRGTIIDGERGWVIWYEEKE